MSRTFITGIAVAAFIAVELLAVQPTEAQRLRNLLRRNNNNGCNNCCNGCGIPSQSTGSSIVSEGYVESSSATAQGMIINESPITSSYPGETYSSPIISAPMETYAQPIVQGPTDSFATTQSFAQSQPYVEPQFTSQAYAEPQPYVEPYIQQQSTFQGETMAQATPYVEGMATSEYPIQTGSINSYVTPASYGLAQGCVGCGGPAAVEQASWNYDNGAMQGQIIGDSNVVNGGIVDGGFVPSGGSQGQVLGCASGDCGGQVFDGGQVIGGGQVIDSGQIIGANQGITSGGIVEGNVVYGGSTGFESAPVEQIISSEIISETPIDASDSTGTPEIASPVEPAPADPSTDTVPDAPEADGKEA